MWSLKNLFSKIEFGSGGPPQVWQFTRLFRIFFVKPSLITIAMILFSTVMAERIIAVLVITREFTCIMDDDGESSDNDDADGEYGDNGDDDVDGDDGDQKEK